MSKFTKFLEDVKTFFVNVKNKLTKGYKWLGIDCIINMETSALLVMLFMVFFHRKGRFFVVPRVRICYDKYNGKELSQMKNHLSRLPAAALLLPCLSLPVQAAAIKPEELDALYYGAYITAGALLYILAGKLWKKFMDRRK